MYHVSCLNVKVGLPTRYTCWATSKALAGLFHSSMSQQTFGAKSKCWESFHTGHESCGGTVVAELVPWNQNTHRARLAPVNLSFLTSSVRYCGTTWVKLDVFSLKTSTDFVSYLKYFLHVFEVSKSFLK